jgi:hypothetical protein
MICLELYDEPENSGIGNWNENEARGLLSSTWIYDSIGSGNSHGDFFFSFSKLYLSFNCLKCFIFICLCSCKF